jgi:hypothetical protein
VNRLLPLFASLVVLSGCAASRQAQWDNKFTAQTAASGETAEALIAQGDEAWAKRDDKASMEAAIKAWERASDLNPADGATLTKLSHGYYFLADAHLRGAGDTSEVYLTTYEKSLAYGERAMGILNPKFKEHMVGGGSLEDGVKIVGAECVEPMYWYAASLGRWSRAKGFATVLGNKDRIKAVMTRVLELDPKFFHGAADRYFGAYYAVAPGFAGGDMNKSKDHFEKSLALAPAYLGTKVLMADVWAVKQQDRKKFDSLLDDVLAAPEDGIPGLEPEARVEKQKAKEMKAKAEELF